MHRGGIGRAQLDRIEPVGKLLEQRLEIGRDRSGSGSGASLMAVEGVITASWGTLFSTFSASAWMSRDSAAMSAGVATWPVTSRSVAIASSSCCRRSGAATWFAMVSALEESVRTVSARLATSPIGAITSSR
jgi:hypothetical protein